MSKEKALPDFDSDQMDQLSWMFWTAAWLQDARRIAKPGALSACSSIGGSCPP